MNDQDKLKQIIGHAISNGWDHGYVDSYTEDLIRWCDTPDEQVHSLIDSTSMESLIFSHDFCKAFFGVETYYEEEYSPDGDLMGHETPYKLWEYHIRQLSLSENRIDYLYDYLKQK